MADPSEGPWWKEVRRLHQEWPMLTANTVGLPVLVAGLVVAAIGFQIGGRRVRRLPR